MATKPSRTEKKLRVPAGRLRHTVNPRTLPSSKSYSRHRTHIIGQDRAIDALKIGLRLDSPGYNIFISGPSGSGKMTTTRHILAEFKQPRRPLKDYAYVYNFIEPERPRLLVLQPGEGPRLKKSMTKLIESIMRELPKSMAAEGYQKEKDRILNEYQGKEHELISAFQEKVRNAKFAVVEMQNGPAVEHDVLPVIEDEPQPLSVLEDLVGKGKLTRAKFRKLADRHQKLRNEMEQIGRRTRRLSREMSAALEEIDRHAAGTVIDTLIEDMHEQFENESVLDYLDEVREALLERIPALVRRQEDGESDSVGAQSPGEVAPDPLALFQVNVILQNAGRKGCPVVFEPSPTVVRLLGTVERSMDESGRMDVGFMDIRAGSLLRANGGFLTIKGEDLLIEPGAWKVLKQTLSTGQLEIRLPEGPMAMMSSALKPDPIPLDVKIIMHGDEDLYRSLYLAEDDFKKTFKVKAEFDVEMDYNPTNTEKFMAFVQRVVGEEDLLPPNRPAIAALLEEAIRLVEDQSKMTTRFRVVADMLREASYWAHLAGKRTVGPPDVARTILERRRRVNLAEEKYREDIERDVVMVSTAGRRVGQVNGLAVFDLGDYSFGKPCRITAAVGMGRSGIVNVERESGLSGAIHDKGVYILSGFLKERFGRFAPLAIDASICFEQSYTEIDGDSASSTEMYALLSCLADLPIRQGIAVTGSVNQRGDIQPIGGINHKIEGFFDICRMRGLNGRQGVIIPRGNLPHLMLGEEVINAVRKGRFSIFAVSTVDEGLEILTGVQAGRPDRKGVYPAGSINRLVADRLSEMTASLRDFK